MCRDQPIILLEEGKLWEILQGVWGEYNRAKIANMHVHHHQMANAVIKWKGGDKFATASRALHCAVRTVVVPIYRDGESTEPCGFEVIESLNEVGGLDSLRYDTPDVMAEYKRDGELLPEHKYNPQKLLPDDIHTNYLFNKEVSIILIINVLQVVLMMNLIRSGKKMRRRGDKKHNLRHGIGNWINITTIQTQQYT